jgi:hypothetical protein
MVASMKMRSLLVYSTIKSQWSRPLQLDYMALYPRRLSSSYISVDQKEIIKSAKGCDITYILYY